jgi:hypothetical protein
MFIMMFIIIKKLIMVIIIVIIILMFKIIKNPLNFKIIIKEIISLMFNFIKEIISLMFDFIKEIINFMFNLILMQKKEIINFMTIKQITKKTIKFLRILIKNFAKNLVIAMLNLIIDLMII